MNEKTSKTDAEWRELLSDEEYYICREKGTERAFSGEYYENNEKGVFVCRCCNAELFESDSKYDSGSGWPSFYQAKEGDLVHEEQDLSGGMVRTEISCRRCDSHLGHVFRDGPAPTGLRYCVNSMSLRLERS